MNLPKDGSIPELESDRVREGKIVRKGDAVSAEHDGHICEGNVRYILPYGAEWFDPEWKGATVVIRDHEGGITSNWDPRKVTKL